MVWTVARLAQREGLRTIPYRRVAKLVARVSGEDELTESAWGHKMSGRREFTAQELAALAELAGVPLEWLVAGRAPAPEGYNERIVDVEEEGGDDNGESSNQQRPA